MRLDELEWDHTSLVDRAKIRNGLWITRWIEDNTYAFSGSKWWGTRGVKWYEPLIAQCILLELLNEGEPPSDV